MSGKKNQDSSQSNDVEQLIQDASKKLHLNINWVRKITPEDIIWLLDHCPFLQMVNAGMSQMEDVVVNFIEARTRWIIHDYGDAMSSSPGKFLFNGGDFRILTNDEDDKGGKGGRILNPGKGTLRNQAYMTAMEMVELAFKRGWVAIRFVDGHPMMERAAWIKATELGMGVEGYKPGEYDKKVRNRVRMSLAELEELRREFRPDPAISQKKQL